MIHLNYRLKWVVLLTVVFSLFSLPVFASGATTSDYRTVIADMPRVGDRIAGFPSYISVHGDPSYAYSFSGQYNGLEINGYVNNGYVASLVIRPAGGVESHADPVAVAQAIANIYGSPSFAHVPEVYEWKYNLNDSQWSIQFFGSAGVMQGG